MTDYRITVKVQNNNILRRIYEAGYTSISDFCKRNENISQSTLGEVVNMKIPVFTKTGDFITVIKRTAEALCCLPEDLFSDAQLTAEVQSNIKTYEVSEDEMRFMLLDQQEQKTPEQITFDGEVNKLVVQALQTLTPREKKVISLRMGLDGTEALTLVETAKVFGITAPRIRQIEAKALRKLRHPSRSAALKEAYEEVI